MSSHPASGGSPAHGTAELTFGPTYRRSWISWINVALGLWLVVAAFVLHHRTGSSITEEVIAGLFVALAALWSAGAFRPIMSQAANLTVVLSGLWVLIAPFALRYDHPTPAVVNELVVGAAIVVLSVIESRTRARAAVREHDVRGTGL